MELVKTYEEYNELNKEYVKYIQMVMESDISNHDNIIINNLEFILKYSLYFVRNNIYYNLLVLI